MIRNLICHVYPRTAGQKWRRTAAHLIRRRELFTGRRILTVALDNTTDPIEDVRQTFAPLDAEFIVSPNAELGETATFFPALDRIESNSPDEITFRCHSKGCTHAGDHEMSHPWADVMFAANLDYPELIDCLLSDAAICGAFRKFESWPFPDSHAWHYQGSFYWFRHDRTFSRNWRWLMPTFYGIEAWPGVFPREASACTFFDQVAVNLYAAAHWSSLVAPRFREWCCGMERLTGRKAWLPADSLLPGMGV
ncbi:MAG TPA: hypothetical protein VGM05_33185 [Planctomycetaceae bacterium]